MSKCLDSSRDGLGSNALFAAQGIANYAEDCISHRSELFLTNIEEKMGGRLVGLKKEMSLMM